MNKPKRKKKIMKTLKAHVNSFRFSHLMIHLYRMAIANTGPVFIWYDQDQNSQYRAPPPPRQPPSSPPTATSWARL